MEQRERERERERRAIGLSECVKREEAKWGMKKEGFKGI